MNAGGVPNVLRTPVATSRPPFDKVMIAFHWATVLMVFAMFATAWLHTYTHNGVLRASLLLIHRSLGTTIWVGTVVRLAWRLTNAKLPPFPTKTTKIHRGFVQASEYSLYGLLLSLPATGLASTLFRGRQFGLLFWQFPILLPEDNARHAVFHWAHQIGAWALGILVAVHSVAALVHHFLLRDDVLQCMAPVLKAKRHKREFRPRNIIRRPSFAKES
jgi:cytochrome b561